MRSIDNTGTFSFQKIHRKKIIFLFSILLVMTGCGSEDAGFHSSKDEEGDGSSAGRQSRDVNVRIVVDVLNNQKGRKGGQHRSSSGGGSSTGDSSSSNGSSSGDDTVTSSPEHREGFQYGEREKGEVSLMKMDILFYLAHKDDGRCWKSFSWSVKKSGFFSHIEGFNWQAAAAFYSLDPVLYRFRKNWSLQLGVGGNWLGIGAKPVYVLKKDLFSTDESDKYLSATISTEYARNIHEHYDPKGTKWRGEPQFPWPHKPKKIAPDPLFGLNRLLKENPKTFVRKKSKAFVVLFEFDNYHYTPAEWKNFAEKYADTYFIALAARRGMASNLPHSSLGLKWLPCNYTHIAQQLAKYIRDIASE